MDQLFGLFKTIYGKNFDLLWEYRIGLNRNHPKYERITWSDIGLLMFGVSIPGGPVLQNDYAIAFSPQRVRHEWAKVGLYPITRKSLESKKIQHEILVDDDGNLDTAADPKAAYLQELVEANELACNILTSFGYNGDISERAQSLTKPHTKERQDAIRNAKSQGVRFRAGVATLNDDDFFCSEEMIAVDGSIKEMEQAKKVRIEAADPERKAFSIYLLDKSHLSYTSKELKEIITWKTGKLCPSKARKLEDRQKFWQEVKGLVLVVQL